MHSGHPHHSPDIQPTPARRTILLPLVVLLGLHPVVAYLYLPALPELQRVLGMSAATAQLTLTAMLAGFAGGQLLSGPVADRHGRRPVLLAGLMLLLCASMVAATTTDTAVLLVARLSQGLGVAAAAVCARAILRDLYQPVHVVRMLSTGFSWLGLVSLLGPPMGAMLAEAGGVRAALGMIAACALLALLLVLIRVPETRHPGVGEPARVTNGWRRILCHPTFGAYTALAAASYAGHYVFLVLSPFVLINDYGLTPARYALVLSLSSLVHLAGTIACRRWLAGRGILITVRRAGLLSLAGGLSMVLGLSAGHGSAWAIILPQWLYVFGHAIHQSCGQAAVTAPFPREAGLASALSGCLLTVLALLLGEALKRHVEPGADGMAGAMAVCAVLTATVAWTLVQRYGEIDPARSRL